MSSTKAPITMQLKIQRGEVFTINGRDYEFYRRLSDRGLLQFEDMEDRDSLNIADEELVSMLGDGQAKRMPAVLLKNNCAGGKNWTFRQRAVAIFKASVVRAFREGGTTPFAEDATKMVKGVLKSLRSNYKELRAEFDAMKVPNRSTQYRWLADAPEHYEIDGYVPNFRARGRYKFADWPDWMAEAVELVVAKVYLVKGRKPGIDDVVASLQSYAEEVCLKNGWPIPVITYERIRRYIASLDLYHVTRKRYGKAYADRRFRAVFPREKLQRPLQVVELDATRLDIYVRWKGRKNYVRPWLTLIIDVYSRCIVGLHLSVDPPSIQTVAQALRNAFYSKGYVRNFTHVKNGWPCWGRPEVVVVDRGKENISDDVINRMATELGLTVKVLPGKSPWMKGTIERFFRTLNEGLLHKLQGTTLSNYKKLMSHNPLKGKHIDIDDFYEILHWWILDVYHQRPHAGLMLEQEEYHCPIDVWCAGVEAMPVDAPPDLEKLLLWTMKNKQCKLTRQGIKSHSMMYNSQKIVDWLADPLINGPRNYPRDSVLVNVKYDPTNLGTVMVEHPLTKEWQEVSVVAKHSEYATGISEWQHNHYMSISWKEMRAKYSAIRRTSEKVLMHARSIKRQILDNDTGKTRQKQQNARQHGLGKLSSVGENFVKPTDSLSSNTTASTNVPRGIVVSEDFDPYVRNCSEK